MAKAGRKPTSTETLIKRGSWLASKRLKDERAARAKAASAPEPKSPVRPPLPSTAAQWRKLLMEIPGYDPFRGAEAFHFDPDAATAVLDFFETRLRHVKGPKARQCFILERWERAFLANLFGWMDEGGFRRYRECFLFIPRKNGKTPLAAGIILYMLAEDGEYGAEIYGTASTYSQAALVFAHARGMVMLDEELCPPKGRCKIFKGQAKAIEIDDERAGVSVYRVACSEGLAAHGWNSLCVIIDELHTQPDAELHDAAKTSFAGKDQPLFICISTSDFQRIGSICNEKHDRASKIRDGILDIPRFLPVIYEAPADCDWHDREVWKAANPNLGVSVTWDYIEAAHAEACESPANENTFKRLHLNIRTAQDVRLVTKEAWDKCAAGSLDLDDYHGQVCWAGLDLAAYQDLIAFVLAFKSDYGTIQLVPMLWLPEQTARERERKDRIPYTEWARQGFIRLTDGGEADYSAIRRDIVAVVEEHELQLRDIAVDPCFQGLELSQNLREQDGLPVTKHGQGFISYAAPMKSFMEHLAGGRLEHGGHPVLAWHASNVMAKLDAAGNMKPDREKSTEKIDGFVAAVMALGRATADVEADTEPMTPMWV